MNRQAFTLIELLAVIVILAIIALIAVPIVINIINDSKKESLQRSIDLYIDTIQKRITQENLKIKYNPDSCEIQEDGNLICYEDGVELLTADGTSLLKIDIKGTKPKSGRLVLSNGKIIASNNINISHLTYEYDIDGNIIQIPSNPGLYDSNYKLVATWDELVNNYDVNIERDWDDSSSEDDDLWIYNVDNPESKTWTHIQNSNEKLRKGKILVLPSNITKIGTLAFYRATLLEKIIIPDSVISIKSSAFFRCSNLKSIIIPNTIVDIELATFGYCENLTSIIIPDSVTSIGFSAFWGCSNLKKVTFEHKKGWYLGYSKIDVTDPSKNAANLIDPNKDYRIKRPYGLYDDNDNLLLYWDNLVQNYGLQVTDGELKQGLKNILQNNENLSNATKLLISPKVNTIGEYAFYECTSLKNIILPNSVTSIGTLAFSRSGITNITIPNSVTNISFSSFNNSSSLKNIMFEKNSKLTTIDIDMLSGTNITSITIPANVTDIMSGEYSGDKLMTIKFEKGSKLTEIVPNMFANNTYITSIEIPENVDYIESYAFEGCDNLTSVIFKNQKGWIVDGEPINVENSNLNATRLKETYLDSEWERNE